MKEMFGRFRALAGGVALVTLSMAVVACSGSAKPAAATVAPALGLTAQNLSGRWIEQGKWQPPGPAQRHRLYACLGHPIPTLAAQSASSTFKSPSGVVAFSVTDIFSASSEATSDIALQRTTSFAGCAAGLAAPMFSVLPPGTIFGKLTAQVRPPPAVGDGAVAHRFTLQVTEGRKSETATADTVTVIVGSSEVTVSFVGTAASLAAVSEADVLQSLVAAR